ncbi:hypothetical protein GGI07_003259 [Coemansia sp. Benny D115]|nr:hypothetical protein GGI07_003259 [Coemansia sp. Benny D115]
MSETESIEPKRKRQDSVADNPAESLATSEDAAATPDASSVAEDPTATAASSPAKRPRTKEDADDNDASVSGSEEANDAAQSVQAIEIDQKDEQMEAERKKLELAQKAQAQVQAAEPEPPKKQPVFGSAFGMGFGGFASAAKKASPFAAFTGANSGFAKYAAKKDDISISVADSQTSAPTIASPLALAAASASASATPVSATASAAGGAPSNPQSPSTEKSQTDLASPRENPRSFADMLATQGTASLESASVSGASGTTAINTANSPDVPMRTFEEDETCLFSTKGKLFELSNGNWKERGGGQFKVNRHNENTSRRRMVMRTDLTFRLILNAPMFSGLKPTLERRFVRFTCFDGESRTPTTFALRFPNDAIAAAAYAGISENIPDPQDHVEEEQEQEQDEQQYGADSAGISASGSRASSEEPNGDEQEEAEEEEQEEDAEEEEDEDAEEDDEEDENSKKETSNK